MKTLITRMIGMYLNFLGIVAPRLAGKKGFLIFCRPFRSPLNFKQLEFLNSAEKFTIEHYGNSIQGYKWGNGDKKRNEPGTVYKYNDTRVNVLALAILNVWRRPLPQVLKEKIMDPIGASNTWRWTGYENSWIVLDGEIVQSVSGGSHWGGGMFISAMDQARFGYLTLRKGRWKDKQILSEKWIAMASTPGPANKSYGFMNYFLKSTPEKDASAPATAFTHVGAGANIIYVDQENDLVVVARWIDSKAQEELIERVLKSLEKK